MRKALQAIWLWALFTGVAVGVGLAGGPAWGCSVSGGVASIDTTLAPLAR